LILPCRREEGRRGRNEKEEKEEGEGEGGCVKEARIEKEGGLSCVCSRRKEWVFIERKEVKVKVKEEEEETVFSV